MKVCVVGAGAIGGYMAVHIAKMGHEVSVVARGPHLAAIQEKGLKLIEGEKVFIADNLMATKDIKELGCVDVVLLALKSHQISPIVNDLSLLLDKDTVFVTLQNGIPWWYFQNYEGKHASLVVESVDPGGELFHNIDPGRIIGCIAYPAATIKEPGVIMHIEGNRFPVGELNGLETLRVKKVSQLFTESGFRARILDDIRSEIWLKLWGNLTFNPISALTHSTLVDICQFDLTRDLVAKMMKEAQVVGESLGAHFRVPIEKRISGAEMVGKHKTSMLQDVKQGSRWK
jgi:Ketopantoate reductase